MINSKWVNIYLIFNRFLLAFLSALSRTIIVKPFSIDLILKIKKNETLKVSINRKYNNKSAPLPTPKKFATFVLNMGLKTKIIPIIDRIINIHGIK